MIRGYQWVERVDSDGFVDQFGQLIEVDPVGRHALFREVVEDAGEGGCHLAHPIELDDARQRP